MTYGEILKLSSIPRTRPADIANGRGLTRRSLLTTGSALAVGLAAGVPSREAAAATRVDVTQGTVAPMPIAIPDFVGGSPAHGEGARGVTRATTNTLRRSGLFARVDPQAFIERIVNVDAVPKFPDWRAINAQALVTGRITRQGDGRLKAEFRLWDVASGQQLTGQVYTTTPDNWRRIGHIISDAVYERLTGEKGYFDTRIVFVHHTAPQQSPVKRLPLL